MWVCFRVNNVQNVKLVSFQLLFSISKQHENRQLDVHAVLPVRQCSSQPLLSSDVFCNADLWGGSADWRGGWGS